MLRVNSPSAWGSVAGSRVYLLGIGATYPTLWVSFIPLPRGSEFLCHLCPAGSKEASLETLPAVREPQKLEQADPSDSCAQPALSLGRAAVRRLFIS